MAHPAFTEIPAGLHPLPPMASQAMQGPCRPRVALLLAGLLASSIALSGEPLPESAPGDEPVGRDMAERFPAPVMETEEMERLFLETPTLIEPAETRRGGGRTLPDQQRYAEQDPSFIERLRSQGTVAPPPPPEQTTPPLPPVGIPVREL